MESSSHTKDDYRLRRGEISAYGRALDSSKQLALLFLIVGCSLIVMIAVVLVYLWPVNDVVVLLILCLLSIFIVGGLWKIYHYNHEHFVEPNLALRIWLQKVCDGELRTIIDLGEDHPHFKELNFHTRNLASALRELSDDMDVLVESQTNKLNEQKNVLELLFKLTADV